MTTDVIARLRLMHKPRTERPGSACVQCGIVWPCPTSKVLDEVDTPADAGIRDRIAQALADEDARHWGHDHDFESQYGGDPETDGFVNAVLAVLPAPADQAAVLREAADAIDAETRLAKEHQILEPDKFRPCRDASAQLRRLADEAQQPEAVTEAFRLRAALERGRRLALTFEVSGNEFIADQIRTALDVDEPADQGQAEGAQR